MRKAQLAYDHILVFIVATAGVREEANFRNSTSRLLYHNDSQFVGGRRGIELDEHPPWSSYLPSRGGPGERHAWVLA